MKFIYYALIGFVASIGQVSAKEVLISVPTDASAKYYILEKSEANGRVTVVTKRVGSSGTSYSKRLIDCNGKAFMYLGDGSTLEEMKKSKPDTKMSALVPGSISGFVAGAACKNN
jgi:hypothetical protein